MYMIYYKTNNSENKSGTLKMKEDFNKQYWKIVHHKPSEVTTIHVGMNQYFSLQIIKIYIGIDKKNPILRKSS